ncbi:unnamed protein product, partial [Brugia timori]
MVVRKKIINGQLNEWSIMRKSRMAALDGRDLKWIKVAETKGCHLMTVGAGSSIDPCHYFCVAIKKSVW